VIVDYIDAHRHRFGVEPICAALHAEGITIVPSGCYAAKKRPPSRRSLADAALAETIEATFWDREKGRGVYGARKMWHQLRRDGVIGPAGRPIARCTVERLMRELGLRGARRGRPVLTTRADRRSERAPDLVDRNFTAAAPNRLWVVDLTYVPTWSGMCSPRSSPTCSPGGSSDGAARPACPPNSRSTPWRWLYGPAKQQVTPARDDWTG
jgi:putative transposase